MKKLISDETKIAVVNDYRTSSLTMKELCKKYGVSSGSINRWDKIIDTEPKLNWPTVKAELESETTHKDQLNERVGTLEENVIEELEREVRRVAKHIEFLQAENDFLRGYIFGDDDGDDD